ncbi:hypothetical protein AAVH_38635 [Aphelenchoides avenae]|nr:hypothetical protein AAVH_38635 [Aphelenchus avenae]
MAEIEDEFERILRKIPSLTEESEHGFFGYLDQHILLAFTQSSRETQSELEAAMPWLMELQDDVQEVMGDVCSVKPGNDVEQEGSEERSSFEEK